MAGRPDDPPGPEPGGGALRDAWLARDPLPAEPFGALERWLAEAFEEGRQPNPHAVALATVDPDGRPSVRIVLCKALEPASGSLLFYTNLESRKGRALAAHPHAAAVFHFGPQERQARLEGPVTPVAPEEADAYFASRPREAQLGAWASAQSRPVASRDALRARYEEAEARRAARAETGAVPRPPFWSGYRLHAERVELWVGRPGRLHDRAVWVRTLEPPREDAATPAGAGRWEASRLQP